MVDLLVIADDFTGALDTGVRFAQSGAKTRVVIGTEYNFEKDEIQTVLVINAESRHLPPRDAYNVVFNIAARALKAGVKYIYKKTDSALRGNIGMELAAMAAAAGAEVVPFAPAFPAMGRTTKNGVQYIDGVPVADSVFGQDPFEPVTHSSIMDIVAEQTDYPGVRVFDAETDEDLRRIAHTLGPGGLRAVAGCAGFAAAIGEELHLTGDAPEMEWGLADMLVVCGSMNPITLRQLNAAEREGFPRLRIYGEDGLKAGAAAGAQMAKDSGRLILDGNVPTDCRLPRRPDRRQIPLDLAEIAKSILDGGFYPTILCTGGDALLGFFQVLGIKELDLIREIADGVPLALFRYRGRQYPLISKSGGFGGPDLICDIHRRLQQKYKKNGVVKNENTADRRHYLPHTDAYVSGRNG